MSAPLMIGPDCWVALPDEVLPKCETGGGTTHVIYSATVYVSVPLDSRMPTTLPAMVVIDQAEYARLLAGQS